MSYQDILRASGTIQAVALASHNVEFARKKKKRPRDFVEMGTTNIVVSALLKEQAGFW